MGVVTNVSSAHAAAGNTKDRRKCESRLLEIAAIKQRRDGLRIEVHNGNIESAIRALKRKMTESGIFRELRERELNPGVGDRREEKSRRAEAFRAHRLRKQAALRASDKRR